MKKSHVDKIRKWRQIGLLLGFFSLSCADAAGFVDPADLKTGDKLYFGSYP